MEIAAKQKVYGMKQSRRKASMQVNARLKLQCRETMEIRQNTYALCLNKLRCQLNIHVCIHNNPCSSTELHVSSGVGSDITPLSASWPWVGLRNW